MFDHMCKMLHTYKSCHSRMGATKRIPASEHVWTLLYDLKKPGQTYDSLIEELVNHEKELRFLREMDAIESEADFSELKLGPIVYSLIKRGHCDFMKICPTKVKR